MKKPRKPLKLGVYQLGSQWVAVWADPQTRCGAFHWPGEKPSLVNIYIGIQGQWHVSVAVAMHEAMETLMDDLGLRLERSAPFAATGSDCYLFHFNHPQFCQLTAAVGAFLSDVLPDLKKQWNKLHK